MKLIQTELPEVVLIEPRVFADERGWFMESFNEAVFHRELAALGLPIPDSFVQDNHSASTQYVLRGLHYQLPPYAQGKLVRVVKGAAFDVAVDIRKDSPNYGKWVGFELNADNKHMLWIPPGFAHGFMALEPDTHFLYKTTNFYNKESEGSICWDDKAIAIDWPMASNALLNEKDATAPFFADALPWETRLESV
ncbi:MAG: dTDP-4-dehydrorhamnose 3,5-epimerase [Proteobacteria bacterium]|nr:dTDP-4-dehydrorhamnose 3,5-epimerase [Pseudomonadota bacterium]